MTTLVIGATGTTGRLLVEQLLAQGESVKLLVRSANLLPENIRTHANTTIIKAHVHDLSAKDKAKLVKNCNAVAFCLGHNITFKGLFGHPRRLVTSATRGFCEAIRATKPEKPIKFLLMNTAGNSNRDLNEPISFAQKCIIVLLRMLLPPHVDNEKAADYLRTQVGQNDPQIEWVAIRSDDLIDEKNVSPYEVKKSPTRSAIFDAGKTSRINVANFMSTLIPEPTTWVRWRGQMPVIYNKA